MIAKELTRWLFELCEGLEDQVDQAPVLTPKELGELVGEFVTGKLDPEDLIFPLAKSIKVGAVSIEDVM